MTPANSKSILRMRSIESFPNNELLWLMNIFGHADGYSTCRPYAVRVEARNRASLNSIGRHRDKVAKCQLEHCWFDDPKAFQEAQANCSRLIRNTSCMLALTVVRQGAVDKKKDVLTVVFDGVWMDHDFMIRRLVNVIFTVECSADVGAWIAIQDAVQEQAIVLLSLERLAVQVFRTSSDGDTVEEMARFMAFSLEDLARAREIVVEVHCLDGPMSSLQTWVG